MKNVSTCFARVALLAGLAIEVLAPFACGNTLSYSDGDFGANWSAIQVGPTGSISASRFALGGHPGAYWGVTNHVDTSDISAVSLRSDFTFTPSISGAIGELSFTYDAITQISEQGQGTAPALLQYGKLYEVQPENTAYYTSFTSLSFAGLSAAKFFAFDGSGTHPDFSATGSTIVLGFANSNGGTGIFSHRTTNSEYDNFSVSVNFTPPAPLLRAGTSTAIPSGDGTFTSFGAPSLSAGAAAFFGTGVGGQQGIYVGFPPSPIYPPGPIKVADINTAVPGDTGHFTSFYPPEPVYPPSPVISGSNVAFFGAGSNGQQGIYAALAIYPAYPPTPVKVADMNTPIPGGTGTFTSFYPPNPVMPSALAITGNNVAFFGAGSNGQQGIYAALAVDSAFPPTPVKVADTNNLIPHGTGNFTGFAGLAFPPNPVIPTASLAIAFIGTGVAGQEGVYVGYPPSPIAPPIKAIVDSTTMIPDGSGDFTGFGAISLTDTDLAFLGMGNSGQKGIYFQPGWDTMYPPDPVKIFAIGDMLDGKTISDLSFSSTGLWGEPVISFDATFTDGSQGIYSVNLVPEPAALELAGIGLLGLLTCVRLRRTKCQRRGDLGANGVPARRQLSASGVGGHPASGRLGVKICRVAENVLYNSPLYARLHREEYEPPVGRGHLLLAVCQQVTARCLPPATADCRSLTIEYSPRFSGRAPEMDASARGVQLLPLPPFCILQSALCIP